MSAPAHERGIVDAAAVLLSIGRERAARLLSHFDAEEVDLLSRQTDRLSNLTQEKLDEVARSFEREFARGAGLLNPGRSFRDILNETRNDSIENDIAEDAQTIEDEDDPWSFVAALSEKQLASYLADENMAIAAFVFSKLPAEKAAAVLKRFDGDARAQIVSLILKVKATPRMDAVICSKVSSDLAVSEDEDDSSESWKSVASIINCLDADEGDAITQLIKQSASPDAFEAVVGQLFRFDDIASMTAEACTALCGVVETSVLTVALHGADPALSEALLSTFSHRARRMVESELEASTNPKAEAIDQARRSVAQTALALAADGQLTLPPRE